MFRSSGSKKALTIASRVAGWGLMALAAAWFLYCVIRGGYFVFGSDTEINLRDPFLIITKTLALVLLALLFLGKKECIVPLLRFAGTKAGMWSLTGITALAFVIITLLRFYLFYDHANDMALFDHYLYNLSHGFRTMCFANYPKNIFSDHIWLLFYPYSLVYRLGGIYGVMIVHKVLLAGIIPLSFLLAKSLRWEQERIGFLVIIVAIVPRFLSTGVGTLYLETMFFPLGIAALWAFWSRRWLWLVLVSLFMLGLREDGGLVLGFISIYFALSRKNWKWLVLAGASFLISLALIQWQTTLPGFAASRLYVRYGIKSLTDFSGLLRLTVKPFGPKAIAGFVLLCLGFGFLPFLSWRGILSSYLSAMPNLASKFINQATLRGYYGNFVYPLLFAGVVETIPKLSQSSFRTHASIALALALLLGPREFSRRFDRNYFESATRAISLVPRNAPVASTSSVGSKLGARDTIYILTNFEVDSQSRRLEKAPFVIIEETDVYYRHHWQRALDYLKSSGYTEQFSGGGVHLLVRKQNP
ncbi:MAG: DUF2079 domain-containing protein [candidate division WOR-3 bacterium]